MEKLTYEDYTRFGGTSDANSFPLLLLDCENYLENLTMYRIDKLNHNIKRLIVLIIDTVLKPYSDIEKGITSYSDGIETISYSSSEIEKQKNDEIIKLCNQYLTDDLLYRGAL